MIKQLFNKIYSLIRVLCDHFDLTPVLIQVFIWLSTDDAAQASQSDLKREKKRTESLYRFHIMSILPY